MTTPAPGWDELAEALSYELSALRDGVLVSLQVRDRPWQFVQFAQFVDELFAEVSGHTLPDSGGAKAETPAEYERLLALGWLPPSPRDGFHWHRTVAYPPTSQEYDEIITGVIAALREINGVASPAELTFRAWDGGTPDNADWDMDLAGVQRRERS
jgi:hypothetical protein